MFRPKKTLTFLAAFAVATILLVIAAPSAQEGEGAMMPQLETDHHRWLAADAGIWDAACTWHGPEGEMQFTGKETITVDCGGLWSFSTFEADFMGAPYKGRSCTGYDPAAKRFVGAWVDSMNTRMFHLEGTREGDDLVMWTEGIDPMTGGTYPEKHVHTRKGDDQRVFDMLRVDEGQEPHLMMRIVYTRAE